MTQKRRIRGEQLSVGVLPYYFIGQQSGEVSTAGKERSMVGVGWNALQEPRACSYGVFPVGFTVQWFEGYHCLESPGSTSVGAC